MTRPTTASLSAYDPPPVTEDSAKPAKPETWQHIGALAAQIARKAGKNE